MGRFGKRKNQGPKSIKKVRADVPVGERVPRVLSNRNFEEYYSAQNILPEKEEFIKFIDTLKIQLPVNFRITGSRNTSFDLREFMKTKIFANLPSEIDGHIIDKPIPLPWYPDDMAWQYNVGRAELKKNPIVSEFHRFLVAETDVGNVSRQEAVSMIPVLLLDVQPAHYVLDMCAAPGSKTSQLLEAVTANDDQFPRGLVVANDNNEKRAHMLVHQAKRLQSPCLIVTNHDAQDFPRILTKKDGLSQIIQYDRILADVPCSGDGTMRKNKMIWKEWNANNGNGLHRLQKMILSRGCEFLKVGGRLVYSTCSFNPIENEAVVAAIILQSKGAMRLVDVSKKLPGLKRESGITTWIVKDKKSQFLSSFEDVRDQKDIIESMFAPSNSKDLGLENCIRIYPQMQNTGGFFVAVFEKIDVFGSIDKYNQRKSNGNTDLSKEDSEELDSIVTKDIVAEDLAQIKRPQDNKVIPCNKVIILEGEETQKSSGQIALKKESQGWSGVKESPFIFVSDENNTIQNAGRLKLISESYGLLPGFPRDLFVVRSDVLQQDFASIYVVSREAKNGIKLSQVLTAVNSNALKIVNTGVKAFTKNGGKHNGDCAYRICSGGVRTIGPHLPPNRHVTVQLLDVVRCIKYDYPMFRDFTEGTRKIFEELGPGSCLMEFDPETQPNYNGSLSSPLILPFFRAGVSISLLLDKKERASLLNRLTGEKLESTIGLVKTIDI